MNFDTLYIKISPSLKRIARIYNGRGLFVNEQDLYQEMCVYLWSKFKDGTPEGINEGYIVKGCQFHILNYLKKIRKKVIILSLEEPINEEEGTLKDILPERGEALGDCINRRMAIYDVMNDGFTVKEKKVFSLLLKGYTTREAANRLGISHVMVVKYKKRIAVKWNKKNKSGLSCAEF